MSVERKIRKIAADQKVDVLKFRDEDGGWVLSQRVTFGFCLTDEEALEILEKLKDPEERLKYLTAALDVEMNKKAGVS